MEILEAPARPELSLSLCASTVFGGRCADAPNHAASCCVGRLVMARPNPVASWQVPAAGSSPPAVGARAVRRCASPVKTRLDRPVKTRLGRLDRVRDALA